MYRIGWVGKAQHNMNCRIGPTYAWPNLYCEMTYLLLCGAFGWIGPYFVTLSSLWMSITLCLSHNWKFSLTLICLQIRAQNAKESTSRWYWVLVGLDLVLIALHFNSKLLNNTCRIRYSCLGGSERHNHWQCYEWNRELQSKNCDE